MGEYYDLDPRESRPDIEMSPRDPEYEEESMCIQCDCCGNAVEEKEKCLCEKCMEDLAGSLEYLGETLETLINDSRELNAQVLACQADIYKIKSYL